MPAPAEPELRAALSAAGNTRLELVEGEKSLSRLTIVPFVLRIGAARVRMDGIAGVGTLEEYRRRGLSRRLLDACAARMRAGDAALSMLYGIPDFYPKFGYATAGADWFVSLPAAAEELPSGWRERAFSAADLPAVRALYDRSAGETAGAAQRGAGCGTWARLLGCAEPASPDTCRVICDPAGRVAASVWRVRSHWYTAKVERAQPGALVLGEVLAAGPTAADAALAACGSWAAREGAPIERALLSVPPSGAVAAAALRRRATLSAYSERCGESMARVLDPERLVRSLLPELEERRRRSLPREQARLWLDTEIGGVGLEVNREGCRCLPERGSDDLRVPLPQAELARLALGAYATGDLLDRLPEPVDGRARELLCALFPLRHPHMFLPDRF